LVINTSLFKIYEMVRKERLQWEFGVEVLPKIDMQVRDDVNAEDP